MEQINSDEVEETSITLVSKIDIPATYCPKCNLLLPEGSGEKQCVSCGAKVLVKLPSLENEWKNERVACPNCSKVLIAGVNKRPCKLKCSSCNQKFTLTKKIMKIEISCPKCERKLRIKRSPGEKIIKCPACETEIKIRS
jgi:DNA-directed RNA polymerase subunit RPC12/RpoP